MDGNLQSFAPAEPAIPLRHGRKLEQARKIGRLLRLVTGAGAEPTPDQWRALGLSLTRGDAEMDTLIDWMAANDLRACRAMFETALERGIEAVADAPQPLRVFFATLDQRPDWVDEEMLERGAEVCRLCGDVASWVLRDGALMGGYQSPGLNRVLVLTGALEKGASKRLAETSQWWLACTESGGLARFGEGFKTTVRVRLIHALVRRHLAAREDWNPQVEGVPINQMGMAATQLAFSAVFLTGVRSMGMAVSRRDGRAVTHLMRYAGHLMGVELWLLPETEQEGLVLVYQMLLSLVDEQDSSGRGLANALADEPLYRPYPALRWLRTRFDRERNLSINLFFLGRAGMDNLGLPRRYIPWYPLLSAPWNVIRFAIGTRSAASRRRMADAGRRVQRRMMHSLTGTSDHAVGRGLADNHPVAAAR